jgi:fructose-1,6-bisphosphatase/inositol monophosphatase family enzyme
VLLNIPRTEVWYLARVEDLAQGDLVKVDCAAATARLYFCGGMSEVSATISSYPMVGWLTISYLDPADGSADAFYEARVRAWDCLAGKS